MQSAFNILNRNVVTIGNEKAHESADKMYYFLVLNLNPPKNDHLYITSIE